MSPLALTSPTIAVLAVLGVLVLFISYMAMSFLRAARDVSGTPGEAPSGKPVNVMSRRDFQRRALITSVLVFTAEFGGGTIAFLWPNLRGGFGSLINAGSLNDIKQQLQASEQPVYNGAGRFYIVPWDGTAGVGQANYPAKGVTQDGIMPLYQRCVPSGAASPSARRRSGSNVRATARSTTSPASTSWGRRPAGSTASRSRWRAIR